MGNWISLEDLSAQISASKEKERVGRGYVYKPWSKGRWRTIGDFSKYYRSKWESNYARYLQYLKEQGAVLDWKHEPETFWFEKIKRGVRSYKPDFKVILRDCSVHYVEVKGYMDKKSQTKIKRFNKYYPDIELKLVNKDWFMQNNSKYRNLIKDWE